MPPQRIIDRERAALVGVGLMLLVALFGAVDAVIVRQLSPGVHPFVIGFTRSLFGLLVVAPWILSRPSMLQSNYRFLHVLRAALKLASLVVVLRGLRAVAAGGRDGDRLHRADLRDGRGLGVSVGKPAADARARGRRRLLGVMFVLRPGQGGVSAGLLFALLGALLTAVIQLMLKPMSGRDSTETLVAWNLILTAPIALVPALLSGRRRRWGSGGCWRCKGRSGH